MNWTKRTKSTLIEKSVLIVALGSLFLVAFKPADRQGQMTEYYYSPYEKSDPFSPGISFQSSPRESDPLQTLPLDKIAVVATIIGPSSSALVEISIPASNEPTRYFNVKVGDRLGNKLGTIISIFKDRIIVREQIQGQPQDPNQRFQDVTMILRNGRNSQTSHISAKTLSADSDVPKTITEALTRDVMPPPREDVGTNPIRGARHLQMYGSGKVHLQSQNTLPSGRSENYINNIQQPNQPSQDTNMPAPTGLEVSTPTTQIFSNPLLQDPVIKDSQKQGPFSIERRIIAPNP